MRKIILQLAITLDGFIEGPNGEYDWCFTDQDYGMKDFFQQVDTVFYGRKSYDLMLTIGDSVEEVMPGFPKLTEYVFSNSLPEVKPGVIVISGDIEKEVQKIRSSPGKDIWLFGGASLTHSLMTLGLVDEMCLAVHPILLGAGKRLFGEKTKRTLLTLADTKQYSSGLVMLTYRLT